IPASGSTHYLSIRRDHRRCLVRFPFRRVVRLSCTCSSLVSPASVPCSTSDARRQRLEWSDFGFCSWPTGFSSSVRGRACAKGTTDASSFPLFLSFETFEFGTSSSSEAKLGGVKVLGMVRLFGDRALHELGAFLPGVLQNFRSLDPAVDTSLEVVAPRSRSIRSA